MQIVEVKNNLVKISYDTAEQTLILSGFMIIKDSAQSFIGQIIHLEANSKGNGAIIKLLFNFDDSGVISNYNGSIPDINSALDVVQPQELLELLPIQNPVVLGELAQQNTKLTVDRGLLEQNLLICSEHIANQQILTKNLALQLANDGKKVLVFDLEGDYEFSSEKITGGMDFKLPLNYETINFIYENGLEGAKAETKAMIQEIFLEVQEYVKTLPEKFIPFETFKSVVDEQYEETELVELVLLKNKLLKYYESGIFAQTQAEFNSLKASLQSEDVTVFDLSKIDEKIQREMISYAYSQIAELDSEVYVLCNVNDSNSDKKLLKQIFSTKQAYSSLVCSYSFKYLKELKQLSKDLILFAPIQQQTDFAGYNTFLNKLNPNEFVIYGNSTHHLPLIVKLEELVIEQTIAKQEDTTVAEPQFEQTPMAQEDLLNEEIINDVDTFYTAPKSDFIVEENISDELTEDDLDLIDDLNIADNVVNEEIIEEFDNEIPLDSQDEIIEELTEEKAEDIDDIFVEAAEEAIEEELIQEVFEENFDNPETVSQEGFAAPKPQIVQSPEADEEPQAPVLDILPVQMSSKPIVPIYSADIEPKTESESFEQGDYVSHAKYGKGTVEKLITYGSKTLCSINFDNVGRRLLDPSLAEIKKI